MKWNTQYRFLKKIIFTWCLIGLGTASTLSFAVENRLSVSGRTEPKIPALKDVTSYCPVVPLYGIKQPGCDGKSPYIFPNIMVQSKLVENDQVNIECINVNSGNIFSSNDSSPEAAKYSDICFWYQIVEENEQQVPHYGLVSSHLLVAEGLAPELWNHPDYPQWVHFRSEIDDLKLGEDPFLFFENQRLKIINGEGVFTVSKFIDLYYASLPDIQNIFGSHQYVELDPEKQQIIPFLTDGRYGAIKIRHVAYDSGYAILAFDLIINPYQL